MFRVILTLAALALASAACDNSCSGHGYCGERGICTCYDNWGVGLSKDSGDCSQRICPFEFAWVDTPDKTGKHHKYAECANQGICDRGTGECQCFPGYEGRGCKRTSCPNDCSGHGMCAYIEDLPFAATPNDYWQGEFLPSTTNYQAAKTFGSAYHRWDYMKTRGCICDPEWTDVDCSKRMCPYGTDIMDQRNNMLTSGRYGAPAKYQVQHIQMMADLESWYDSSSRPDRRGIEGKTFALTFKSRLNETFTTIPIVLRSGNPYNTGQTIGATPSASTVGYTPSSSNFHDFLMDVQVALESLPNRVIDRVEVHGSTKSWGPNIDPSVYTSSVGHVAQLPTISSIYLNITFVGDLVQGPQHLITVKSALCGDGCTPKLTGLELKPLTSNVTEVQLSDFNSFECGRRGKCDYTTGICTCFSGYTGVACNTITALV